jgi:serine protease Do
MLDTQGLRVHLHDGRRLDGCKVLAIEPVLDLAIVKIPLDEKESLPYYDLSEIAKKPLAQPGDFVLAFSNQFQIAMRNEPMTVQRGVVAAFSKLQARRGVHEAPYTGDIYVVDMISNNPGAAGGALTTRKGELLGIVGKELKNSLTDTWINYSIPIQAKVDVQVAEEKKETLSLVKFVETVLDKGKWERVTVVKVTGAARSYHGIVLVPDVVDRTPPYVDTVASGSPAAQAGIRPDDLIVYINGEQVGHIKLFNEIISKYGPNSELAIEVRRGEKLQTVKMTLKEPLKTVPKK